LEIFVLLTRSDRFNHRIFDLGHTGSLRKYR
jgi:hypothetical protein